MAQAAPLHEAVGAHRVEHPRIGVLALQGGVREHMVALREVGAEPGDGRLPRDLVGLSGLILPGGESTTMRRLVDLYGLRDPIVALANGGAALYGTCAGMILLANRIADGEEPVLSLLDITVERNAYGRQLDSFEAEIEVPILGPEPIHGVFIRAPAVGEVGQGVEVLARDPDGRPIAVQQGRIVATAFHPELTADRRFHRHLLELIEL
jgi:pyridoxal 5'-phosphate synthase pdxT subunit